jgi:hypothetical protein
MAVAKDRILPESRIDIRLKPRAKNDRIAVTATGVIEVAVTSPPIDDRANEHLVALIADHLDIPKSSLSIVCGRHGRNKVVAVSGLTKDTILKKLMNREGCK